LFKYAKGGNPFKMESIEGGTVHGGEPFVMLTMKNRSKFKKKCFEDGKKLIFRNTEMLKDGNCSFIINV
jgi:hypothetical protein